MNSQHTYEIAINASWTALPAIPSFLTTVQVPFNKILNLRFVERKEKEEKGHEQK
jgi:hypothetical protein